MFQSMGPPPSPRYGLSMTVIHNKIYVYGGDSVTGKTDDSAYVYTLDCCRFYNINLSKVTKKKYL